MIIICNYNLVSLDDKLEKDNLCKLHSMDSSCLVVFRAYNAYTYQAIYIAPVFRHTSNA